MTPNYYEGSLKEIFSKEIPLIDVRSSKEFEDGAFPMATNVPILDDDQRHQVGICYKKEGQSRAIYLGNKLVSGEDREAKTRKWTRKIDEQPKSILYCFRGGLRSQISQEWLLQKGKKVSIIEGGYKRLRNFLLTNLEEEVQNNSFVVVSGNTGSGKTATLNRLSASGQKAIDLEGLANHRGSAFGQETTPQPSQIDFENAISIQFIKEEEKDSKSILIEDESIMIGQRQIPRSLYEEKKIAPIFVLKIPQEERVEFILSAYVKTLWPSFESLENSYESFFDFYKGPFDRIKKRFGSSMYDECIIDLKTAVESQEATGSFSHHKNWINKLLVHYYDPLYEKGLTKRKELIIGKGSEEQLKEALKSY